MQKKLLSRAAMEKIMKDAGANRVGEDAKDVLKKELEEIAIQISEKAVKYASHAGRKTVFSSDIKMAVK